jgi:hypothetical protein
LATALSCWNIKQSSELDDTIRPKSAEKAFDKIWHPCMINAQNKLEIERTYLSTIKSKHDKTTANITLNGGKMKALPLKSGMRQ